MVNNKPKEILVTGAGGFLGAATVKNLASRGYKVLGIVRSLDNFAKPAGVDCLKLDLSHKESWDALKIYRPAAVLHFAAAIPFSFEGEDAKTAAEINRKLDKAAILFCEESGARLIYASSASVYGLSFSGIRKETDKCVPVGFYAREKLETEKKVFSSNIKNPCALRVSAPYGTGQKARTVISIFLENALKNEPLIFYGTGSRTQDFTYIDDIAEAFVAAILSDAPGIFNVSGGEPITMKKLASLIRDLASGCSSEIRTSGQPDPQENFRADYDTSLAKEKLGWSSKTGLKEGLLKYIEYLKH